MRLLCWACGRPLTERWTSEHQENLALRCMCLIYAAWCKYRIELIFNPPRRRSDWTIIWFLLRRKWAHTIHFVNLLWIMNNERKEDSRAALRVWGFGIDWMIECFCVWEGVGRWKGLGVIIYSTIAYFSSCSNLAPAIMYWQLDLVWLSSVLMFSSTDETKTCPLPWYSIEWRLI